MKSMKNLCRLALVLVAVVVLACTVIAVSAEENDCPVTLELLDGASVRLNADQSGLRFETRVKTAELEALGAEYEIGTLILPTDMMSGDLTLENANALKLSNKTEGAKLVVDGEYTYFYAAIVDIKAQNYARAFSAVSYITVGDKTYYTEYSAANNSRSIYGVAAEAFQDTAKAYGTDDLSIITAYLDKVLVLNGSVMQVNRIAGYTSPYIVSYSDATDLLTVTAVDGTLAEGDIATILLDYTVYTGGWTVADNKLTASYAMNLVNDFSTAADVEKGSGSGTWSNNGFQVLLQAPGTGATASTKLSVKDGVVTFYADNTDKTYSHPDLTGNLAKTLGTTNDSFEMSMRVKLPDATGYNGALPVSFDFRYNNSNKVSFLVFKDSYVKLIGGTVIAQLSKTEYADITIRVNFAEAKVYGYCNGVLMGSETLKAPTEGMSLLDWARTVPTSYIVCGSLGNKSYASKQGMSFDAVSWKVFKAD